MTTRGFFDEQAALRALERGIRRWRMLGSRRVVRKFIGKVVSSPARRLFPILAVGDPKISSLLIGWMADLGHSENRRRKVRKVTGIARVNDLISDTALHFTEKSFALLGAAVGVVDSMTDAILPDGIIDDLVDIPEEAIQDAINTLSKMARALRTGEKQ